MRYFYRILLTFLPLVIVPLFIGMIVTAVRGNTVVRDLILRNARLELDSFYTRCEEEFDVLSDLGLNEVDFYRINAQNNAIEYARRREIPGGHLFILSDITTLEGRDYGNNDWLTFTSRFVPWDWEIGIAVARDHILSFSRDILKRTLVLLLIMLAPIISIAYLVSRRFSLPLVRLQQTADALAAGNLETRAHVPRAYELANLARSFNTMASNIQGLTRGLEERVNERTSELKQALEDLRRTQGQLVQSEKLSALGQLTAGIAHELNTPLGAILSVSESLDTAAREGILDQQDFLESLTPSDRDTYFHILKKAMKQERKPEILVDRNLRMRVASELEEAVPDDPDALVDAVLTLQFHNSLEEVLPLLKEDRGQDILMQAASMIEPFQSLQVIRDSSEKAVRVIRALAAYIRSGEGRKAVTIDLGAEIDSVLVLFQNKIKQGVLVNKHYARGAYIQGDRDQLSLVWTNLIKNALEAMEYNGELSIETFIENNDAGVRITDTGGGIDPGIEQRIFEPFFTTKPAGAGMGLGLDISKKIVEKEGGRIYFSSKTGKTTFTVLFPRKDRPVETSDTLRG